MQREESAMFTRSVLLMLWPVVSFDPADCQTCHADQMTEFQRTHHAKLTNNCSQCHGDVATHAKMMKAGEGKGPVISIKSMDATKTIANFWPYSTTIFDFIRRSMPWQQPRSLTDDEVYALTAYILAQNKLIGEKDVMNAQTLPKVRMPNRDGFIPRFPEQTPGVRDL